MNKEKDIFEEINSLRTEILDVENIITLAQDSFDNGQFFLKGIEKERVSNIKVLDNYHKVELLFAENDYPLKVFTIKLKVSYELPYKNNVQRNMEYSFSLLALTYFVRFKENINAIELNTIMNYIRKLFSKTDGIISNIIFNAKKNKNITNDVKLWLELQ